MREALLQVQHPPPNSFHRSPWLTINHGRKKGQWCRLLEYGAAGLSVLDLPCVRRKGMPTSDRGDR